MSYIHTLLLEGLRPHPADGGQGIWGAAPAELEQHPADWDVHLLVLPLPFHFISYSDFLSTHVNNHWLGIEPGTTSTTTRRRPKRPPSSPRHNLT